MALLQISEPGKPSIAGAKKLAVGIDLGTTNSLISSGYNGGVEICGIQVNLNLDRSFPALLD